MGGDECWRVVGAERVAGACQRVRQAVVVGGVVRTVQEASISSCWRLARRVCVRLGQHLCACLQRTRGLCPQVRLFTGYDPDWVSVWHSKSGTDIRLSTQNAREGF